MKTNKRSWFMVTVVLAGLGTVVGVSAAPEPSASSASARSSALELPALERHLARLAADARARSER